MSAGGICEVILCDVSLSLSETDRDIGLEIWLDFEAGAYDIVDVCNTLPTKVRLVKAMVFPVVMYGCES